MKQPVAFFVEALEDRIAPASLTYQDVDGDLVRVSTTKGSLASLTDALEFDGNGQLLRVDFSWLNEFRDTSLSIKVAARSATGDGSVNVGLIDASGIDLTHVVVGGDLGKILAGDGNFYGYALDSLSVNSMGVFGTATQGGAPAANLTSYLTGYVGSIKVLGDLHHAGIYAWAGQINSISVGGDLVGGGDTYSGSIIADGAIKKAVIGGSLIGGSGNLTGSLAGSSLDSVVIKGDLIGGSADFTGTVFGVSKLGKIAVGGSLYGGNAGVYTGSIYTTGSAINVNVGGSVYGGDADYSGIVLAHAPKGSLTIGGDVYGGDGAGAGHLSGYANYLIKGSLYGGDGGTSGSIFSFYLKKAVVGGSLVGGSGDGSGSIYTSSSAVSSIVVYGNLTGGTGLSTGSIFLDGNLAQQSGKHGSIGVGGNVDGGSGERSGNVMIVGSAKSVTILGDLWGGSGKDSGRVSVYKLGSLNIGGDLVGSSGENSGSIRAEFLSTQSIGSVKIGGQLYGGSNTNAGSAIFESSVGSFVLGGRIQGGTAADTGFVHFDRYVKTVKILGGIYGGQAESTGYLTFSESAKSIMVGGGIHGGSAEKSGFLASNGGSGTQISAVLIGGSIYGGSADRTGYVALNANVVALSVQGGVFGTNFDRTGLIEIYGNLTGKLNIAGNIQGGSSASYTGYVQVMGSALDVIVGGSVIGGTNDTGVLQTHSGALLFDSVRKVILTGSLLAGSETSGTAVNFGAIRAEKTMGSLTVYGNLEGNSTLAALVSAGGNLLPDAKSNVAIASLIVGGSVKHATILGGYGISGTGINGSGSVTEAGSAQIGFVTVGGNWINSSLATGATTGSAGYWGGNTTSLLPTTSTLIQASIRSLTVKGSLFGDPSETMDSAIVAERIAKLIVGGVNVTPAAGPLQTSFGLPDYGLHLVQLI